jgi:hypothetical protein
MLHKLNNMLNLKEFKVILPTLEAICLLSQELKALSVVLPLLALILNLFLLYYQGCY